ncbi:MAG: ribonuclease PH [Planctomycetes bacterium]|nr:ribonuclease PH [Planctomycetota bacterium]
MARTDGRRPGDLRPVEIIRGYTDSAPGSVLIRAGRTVVLCTACWERGVPAWKQAQGGGWVTAEYDMLPGSTGQRRPRNRSKVDGRTQEIQRLIGRSLRAVVDLDALGENSVLVDCDVLQADGGTRTAGITGAYVAMCDAVRAAIRNRWIARSPIREAVAAVSVGRVRGRSLLDLDYVEDSAADVDMNVVMTASGRFVEVQGTGESSTFTGAEMRSLVSLATRGIRQLLETQQRALRRRVLH